MPILDGHPNVNVTGPLQSQEQAGYEGPELAPFKCSNCLHFKGEGQDCELVEGPIAADAICQLFESASNADQGTVPMGRPING